MQSNNVPQPLFAPASQSESADDFDFNEIFAEYFINEFGDPLNAYTSSMANYSGAAASMAQSGMSLDSVLGIVPPGSAGTTTAGTGDPTAGSGAGITEQQQQHSTQAQASEAPSDGGSVSLPTGGIRTAFHAGIHTPTVGTTATSAASNGQTVKKQKQEQELQQQQQQQIQQPQGMPLPYPGMAFTSVPNPMAAMLQQQQQQQQQSQAMLHVQNVQQQQQQQQQPRSTGIKHALQHHQHQPQPLQNNGSNSTVTTQTNNNNNAARVALPVGVGIRLGGVGGIAPATAQGITHHQHQPQNPQQHQQQQPQIFSSHGINSMMLMNAAAAAAANNTGMSNNGPNNIMTNGMWSPPSGMSEKAVAERRQRNREHAKRSRVRKKFMLESLQEQVRAMQKENNRLRMLVQEHIPEQAMTIIAECCTSNPLFDEGDLDNHHDGGEDGKGLTTAAARKETNLVRSDFSLMQSLTSGQQCFVLSDPKLPDNPIVFASPGFYKLTGYTSKEVLGRNCRFLQGPGTDARAVEVIRKAVATGSDATVCLLNYKADSTPFWNNFFIAALRDSDNCIVNYVGVQCAVEPESGSTALEDKVNAVLPLQNRDDGAEY